MHGAVLKCAAYNEEHNLTTPVSAAISLWSEYNVKGRLYNFVVNAA